ncbi:mucin-3B [Elysia marginata]|uniref:Mucin-3B n=1 Tax=Elysia marginata TaxID=1093978 RepID=A0AAV4HX42_9GAST|nr:mucin-3B [Elysia marginata]
MLTDIYSKLPNFKRVVILGFWQGSIGVNYTVEFGALNESTAAPVATIKLKEELEKVEENLLKLPDVIQEHIKETFNQSVIKVDQHLQKLVKLQASEYLRVLTTETTENTLLSETTDNTLLSETTETTDNTLLSDTTETTDKPPVTKTTETTDNTSLIETTETTETRNNTSLLETTETTETTNNTSLIETKETTETTNNTSLLETTETTDSTPYTKTMQTTPFARTTKMTMTTTNIVTWSTPEPDESRKPRKFTNVALKMDMKLLFDGTFTPELQNKSSESYKKTEQKYFDALTSVYKNLPNFKGVTILGFTNGSIGVSYQVQVYVFHNGTSTPVNDIEMEKSLEEVKVNLLKLEGVNQEHAKGMHHFAAQNVIRQVKSIGKDVCSPKGICPDLEYQCDKTAKACVHKCYVEGVCPENAVCMVSDTGKVQCPCKHSDQRIYYGPNCTLTAEKFGFSIDQIIAASVGTGAFLIFVAGLIVIVILYKRRKRISKPKSFMASSESDLEQTILGEGGDDVHRARTEDQVSSASNTSSDEAASVAKPVRLQWTGGIAQTTAAAAVATTTDWRSALVSGLHLNNSHNSLHNAPPPSSLVGYGYYKDMSLRHRESGSEYDTPSQSTGPRLSIPNESQPGGKTYDPRGRFYRRPERDPRSDMEARRAATHHGGNGSQRAVTPATLESTPRSVISQASEGQIPYRQGQGQGRRSDGRGHQGHDEAPDPDYPVWYEFLASEDYTSTCRKLDSNLGPLDPKDERLPLDHDATKSDIALGKR